jgi:hypothetical protein
VSSLSDQEFQTWLVAVERGETPPPDLPAGDAADLKLAGRLWTLQADSTSRLEARIRRIAAGPSRSPRVGMTGWRWASLGIVAVLALTVTLGFAPARTWAQEMFQRFGVTFLPGLMPNWEAGLPEVVPTRSPAAFDSEAGVRAAADFPLRWPTDFPFDRGQATFLGYVIYSREGTWIESMYGDAGHRYLEMQVFWQQRPGPWPVGDARFKPVDVAGYDGLWGENVPASFIAGARSSLILKDQSGKVSQQVSSPENASLEPINVLLWEEGETLYVLIDPNRQYDRADLLRVAESAYQIHN